MDEKNIKIYNLSKLPTIDYHALTILQGDLKTLKERDKLKLCKSIIKHGFFVPAFVWRFAETMYILDATQRYHSLEALEEHGYSIPNIPYVEIYAKDKKDAAEKLLQITSRYGKINPITTFFEAFKIDITYKNEIAIPELEINFDTMEEEPVEKEIDEKEMEFDHTCPKCGYRW